MSVLLDRHSRLCVPPETAFFDELLPRLADGSNLRALLDAWSRVTDLGLTADQLANDPRVTPQRPASVLDVMLDTYAARQGKPRCGEKTPQHLYHLDRILSCYPNARIICMLRDGRDVALSLQAMPWWQPQTLTDAAQMWAVTFDMIQSYQMRLGSQFQLIRYEALLARPRQTLTALMPHLGEVFEERQLDSSIASASVLERSLAWKGMALGPVDHTAAGRRRAAASAQTVAMLEDMMRTRLQQLDYLPLE